MTGPAVYAQLSIHDPVHLGVDENDGPVYVNLAERNMLVGGEPGGGKSSGLNLIVAHGTLSPDCRLVLVDGKQVELGMWRAVADVFVGPSMAQAADTFEWLQHVMDDRYDTLLSGGRRKIHRSTGEPVYLVVLDEFAYFSATVGEPKDQKRFTALTRDIVARGRAAGVIPVLATQRPSAQVIDTSLRDLFGYRWAFRCSTEASSDPRARLGRPRLLRNRHRPPRTWGWVAAHRRRLPPPYQGRLPRRSPDT